MADGDTNKWIGGRTAVAQVDTLTPGGTIEAGDLFNVTLTDLLGVATTLSVAATSTTVDQTCDDIVAAFNASTNPRFTVITAALVGTHPNGTAVTLTADTAGTAFLCTVATTEANGVPAEPAEQTFSRAATTGNQGPTYWGSALNWSLGTVPVEGEVVVFPPTAAYAVTGYNAKATPLAGYDDTGYAYAIGSASGYLQIDLKHVTYFDATLGSTSGAKFLDIDNAANIWINGAPASPGAGKYGYNLRGDCDAVAATCGKVFVSSTVATTGSIGLGALVGDNMEVNAISVAGGTVTIGAVVKDYVADPVGHTTTLVVCGGIVHNYAALASETITGGTLYNEDGAIAALVGTGGTVYHNTSDTMTAAAVAGSCHLDCSDTLNAKAIATINLYGDSAKFSDPNKVVTWATAFNCQYTNLANCDIGTHFKVTRAAV